MCSAFPALCANQPPPGEALLRYPPSRQPRQRKYTLPHPRSCACLVKKFCTPRSTDPEEFSRRYAVSNLPFKKVPALAGVSTCTEAAFRDGILKMNELALGPLRP